jgi:hypothetical protein
MGQQVTYTSEDLGSEDANRSYEEALQRAAEQPDGFCSRCGFFFSL